MKLCDLAELIQTEEKAVKFSIKQGLVKKTKTKDCLRCLTKKSCVWIKDSGNCLNGIPYCFKCKKCNDKSNIIKDTFFEKESMTLISQVYKVIYEFLLESSIEEAAVQSEMSIEKTIKWYNHCREVCLLSYMKNQEKIGGKGHIVEVGHIVLSSNGAKTIIVGGIDRNSKQCFALYIDSTKKEIILQKIEDFVLPKTKIISSYSFCEELKILGYTCESVENCPRSISKRDPDIHLLNLFRMWRSLKAAHVKSNSYMSLYTFLYFHKKKLLYANDRFIPFLKDIRDLFQNQETKIRELKVEEE